jgi:hypothetical protein
MHLIILAVAALLSASPLFAQQAEPSSADAQQSAAEDTKSTTDLPVSLDHIREGLAKGPAKSILQNLDRKPDFRQEIQIQQKIDELLSTLDLKAGPAPPGGLYGYEQQQRLWNSVDHPLMQPYAAFSGGELITLAIENLAVKYLGGRALNAVTNEQRARAEAAARAEVTRAVADYCAAQPGGGVNIRLCESPPYER